jgi:hypothetical protein
VQAAQSHRLAAPARSQCPDEGGQGTHVQQVLALLVMGKQPAVVTPPIQFTTADNFTET